MNNMKKEDSKKEMISCSVALKLSTDILGNIHMRSEETTAEQPTMVNGIFLLATSKSKKNRDKTFCLGVHRLGSSMMEFIVGVTDNDKEYSQGDKVSYIYNAEYYDTLESALRNFNNIQQ